MDITPFHIALQVRDIHEARNFYGELLACPEGRSAERWVDFNLYGHQLVCHLNPTIGKNGLIPNYCNPVDGCNVPVPHCGVVLSMEDWQTLADKLKSHNIHFIIEPCIRFKSLPGEQATMFFLDPSGNALEFKAFQNISQLFAT